MIEKIKLALRIGTSSFDDELLVLIDACIDDLRRGGVSITIDSDAYAENALLVRTIVLFCKGHYGMSPDERFLKAYENQKEILALSGGIE